MHNTKIAVVVGALAVLIVSAQVMLSQSGGAHTNGMGTALLSGQQPAVPDSQATPQRPPADHRGLNPPFREDDDHGNPSMRFEGVPAIQPSSHDASGAPMITEADVIHYYDAHHTDGHGHYGIGGYRSLKPTSIEKIEFLTEKEVKARVPGYSAGLPDDSLLCLVQYRGSFVEDGPRGWQSFVRPYAIEVFDAHTGNHRAAGVSQSLR